MDAVSATIAGGVDQVIWKKYGQSYLLGSGSKTICLCERWYPKTDDKGRGYLYDWFRSNGWQEETPLHLPVEFLKKKGLGNKWYQRYNQKKKVKAGVLLLRFLLAAILVSYFSFTCIVRLRKGTDLKDEVKDHLQRHIFYWLALEREREVMAIKRFI